MNPPRTFNDEEIKARFLNACSQLLAPFISDRGLRWEMQDEAPFSLWSIQGLRPPPPDSVAEKRWIADNRPTAYQAEDHSFSFFWRTRYRRGSYREAIFETAEADIQCCQVVPSILR
jgi:hypothetical protein